MINGHYLRSELICRGRRTVVNIGLVALVTAIFLGMSLLAEGLQQAFQAPLTAIGADMTVQMAGDVPEQMAGPVLPCSVAPIAGDLISTIADLPGIQSVSPAVLFWDFSDKAFQIVVGFRPGDPAGPALLRGSLLSGRMLRSGEDSKALAEVTWAERAEIAPGDRVVIGGRPFTIIGLVDGSGLSGIGTAHLYIPLAEARELVAAAPQVARVHTFGPRDSNLLFIRAERDKTEDIAARIRQILGENSSVSTPASFQELLGGLFSLTRRFSGMISGMVLVLALLLTVRNAAAAIQQRGAELGIMKAVGWTGPDIRRQLMAEQLLQILLGTGLGIMLGGLAAWGLSSVTIEVPIPWELAPTPHFLPGGERQLFHQVRMTVGADAGVFLPVLAIPLLLGPAAAWSSGRAIIRLSTAEVLRNA